MKQAFACIIPRTLYGNTITPILEVRKAKTQVVLLPKVL